MLRADSPRSVWAISDAGRAWLAQQGAGLRNSGV
jgi:hypothetical protein